MAIVNENYKNILSTASEILKGKQEVLELSLIGAFSGGHQLIEDIPGMGKTTLVYLIGQLLGLNISRIQFTSDLMPSDILGTNIFNPNNQKFDFKKGPLFGEMILADELNRATPRTQSALLQAMDEKKLTIDGEEHYLPEPFIVMATQNPIQQIGTFPLPESQIDRFFLCLTLDFPDRDFERQILLTGDVRKQINEMKPVVSREVFLKMLLESNETQVSDAILDYVLNILAYGRREMKEGYTLSPRAGKDLIRASKTRAYLLGRNFVIPEDVQFVIGAVLAHRLGANRGVKYGKNKAIELIKVVPVNS